MQASSSSGFVAYQVSKLGDKKSSPPVVKIKSPQKGIVIPSVNRETVTSDTIFTDDSPAGTPVPAKRESPRRKKRASSARTSAERDSYSALTNPVKDSKGGITVELTNFAPPGQSKLDVLEAFLPQHLRTTQRRGHLHLNRAEKEIYHLLNGTTGTGNGTWTGARVGTGAGTEGGDSQSQTSVSVQSYRPVHNSSGWSVSSKESGPDLGPELVPGQGPWLQQPELGQGQGQGQAEPSQSRLSLMRPVSALGIASPFSQLPQQQAVGSLWGVDDPTEGMQAREQRKSWKTAVEEVACSEEIELAIQVAKQIEKAEMISHLKRRNATFVAPGERRQTRRKRVAISDYAMQNEILDVHVGAEHPVGGDQDILEAERIPFQQREVSTSITQSMKEMAGTNHASKKLKKLHTYINGLTARKMMGAWHSVEARFNSSTKRKMVVETVNGLAHPVQIHAMSVSALVYMLCSSKVKIGHEEMGKMLRNMDFVSEEHCMRGRRIAALQVLVGMTGNDPEAHDRYQMDMYHLSTQEDPLISLQELTELVYSPDPEERAVEFAWVADGKAATVQAMIVDKKHKSLLKTKTEERKKKMIHDFENTLATLQYSKTLLTPSGARTFTHVLGLCVAYIAKEKENALTNIPHDLLSFLGMDAFPIELQAKIAEKSLARKMVFMPSSGTVDRAHNPFAKGNLESHEKMPLTPIVLPPKKVDSFEEHELEMEMEGEDKLAYARVLLLGPPRILPLLREMVSFGRGLQKMTYREAVTVLQGIAATKISSLFLCFRRRWRYTAARSMWRKYFAHLFVTNFQAFKTYTRHIINTRKLCFRKIKAWQFYCRRARDRREIYRVSFWPFHTWRKYTARKGTAREKVRFLVGRVLPTLMQIKVFNAWKRYGQREGVLNGLAKAHLRKTRRAMGVVMVQWLRCWTRKRRGIRRAWVHKGITMLRLRIANKALLPFYTWRAYARYRRLLRTRISVYVQRMRKVLFGEKKPMRKRSNAETRVWLKIREDKRRTKTRKASEEDMKKKLQARAKERRTSAGMGTVEEEEEEPVFNASARKKHFQEAHRQMYNRTFSWHMDIKECFDIHNNCDIDEDSEEEEEEEMPTIDRFYNNLGKSRAIPSPPVMCDKYYPKLNTQGQEHLCMVHLKCVAADRMNLLEAACRFQFYALRAFVNLRRNAREANKLRLFRARLERTMKESSFKTLAHGLVLRTRRKAGSRLTEAERLYNDVRDNQQMKVIRTRRFTNEVKSILGRDYHDEEADDDARLRRMKMLNLVDPDDEEYGEHERQRQEERQIELRRRREERDKIYQPPDLLEIDRGDRAEEQKQAEKMLQFGQVIGAEARARIAEADESTDVFRLKGLELHEMVEEVLGTESATTERAVARQEEYVGKFKIHAADILLTALVKVYLEVQNSMMKEETKGLFRCLRLPMLLSRSKSMYNRKRMINWIRICRRLNSIARNAHVYYRKRMAWVTFNRWLKFMSMERLDPTPGLVAMVSRRAQLIPGFEQALRQEHFDKSVYVDNKRLKVLMHDFRVVFLRWRMSVNEAMMFRVMGDKARALFDLRLKQKCFAAIRLDVGQAEYMQTIRQDAVIFPIVRLLADIAQIVKRFVAVRRCSLVTNVTSNNRKFSHYIRQGGQRALSYKKFSTALLVEANTRISTEQRMISDCFESRGTMAFEDVKAPHAEGVFPAQMAQARGREFCDPHELSSVGTVVLPGGYRMSKIKFAFASGSGIIGWQIAWSADGAREIESPQRGSWHAASVSTCEFAIPKDEFVTAVEYLYDGTTIVGIRLKLFLTGFTQWLGGRTSMSTLSVLLNTSHAPRLDWEDHRDSSIHSEEAADPALPISCIIGFTGVEVEGRVTRMGVVVRKIRQQHLFSYTWVGDALWKLQAERGSQHGAIYSNPSIDMQSLPSQLMQLRQVGEGVSLVGDSLTMSNVLMSQSPPRSKAGTLEESSLNSYSPTNSENSQGDDVKSLPPPTARMTERRGAVLHRPPVLVEAPPKVQGELASSEVQFFDVLRMRTTELSHARGRALDFSHRVWTDKDLRLGPYGCLSTIVVVRGLTRWLFAALSKRLTPTCSTEKKALEQLKFSKKLIHQAEVYERRANQLDIHADILESTTMPWTGKHLLSPAERATKAEHKGLIAATRTEAQKARADENLLRFKAVIEKKMGEHRMPRLHLSQYVYLNYKLKLAAARHKESLLERMTMEEVKAGLFGSNLKEKLLSQEQMRAIHDSLTTQGFLLKDLTSLERMVEGVIEEGKNDRASLRVVQGARYSKRHSRLASLPKFLAQTAQTQGEGMATVEEEDSPSPGTLSKRRNVRPDAHAMRKFRRPTMVMDDSLDESRPPSPNTRPSYANSYGLYGPYGSGGIAGRVSVVDFGSNSLPVGALEAARARRGTSAGAGRSPSPPMHYTDMHITDSPPISPSRASAARASSARASSARVFRARSSSARVSSAHASSARATVSRRPQSGIALSASTSASSLAPHTYTHNSAHTSDLARKLRATLDSDPQKEEASRRPASSYVTRQRESIKLPNTQLML